jgi:hypothetical protein
LLTEQNPVPAHIIPDKGDGSFSVHHKSQKSLISNIEGDEQGRLEFDHDNFGEVTELRGINEQDELSEKETHKATLQKVKHMQNFFRKEGLSNKIIKDNIEAFEDVPAYVRRNMSVDPKDKSNDSKVSKFTLSTGDDEEPVLRENNAYLNDNVD